VDQAESLRNLISSAGADLTVARRPPANGSLRVIAVTSGKGGVGKTNVSVNLALLAARRGKRVLVIDADLGLANVEIVFGVKSRYHVGDLLNGTRTAAEVLTDGPLGIKILTAGSGVQSLTQLDESSKMRLIAALEELGDSFDLVFIDSGAGIGDNVLFFVGAANEAILVVSPEPTSIVDAYAVIKVLSQQARVTQFGIVINNVVDELPAREIFPRLTTVTNRFLAASIRHLGYVPRDENLHRSIMAQTPLVDLFPFSPASRAFQQIADRLLTETVPRVPAGGLKFMWQRLFTEATGVG
jgi:flagellar biosynthesis protein FlhG